MHTVVVGPGALGCLIASTLLRGKTAADKISLLDYNLARAHLLNQRGLIIHEGIHENGLNLPAYSNPKEVEPANTIFFCVKSYDVKQSLQFCSPLYSHDTLLIFLQNGISHLDYQKDVAKTAVAFGTTTEGATGLGPGEIRHAGKGQTCLGFLQEYQQHHRELLVETCTCLSNGGMQTVTSETILNHIWAKLFINVGINALTVIYNCRNGKLLEIPEAREYMRGAINEAVEVARKKDISVEDPINRALSVCRATGTNISSMLQDIRKGRKTEIDAINGAIVVLAEKHGIPTPINSHLLAKVKEIEELNDRKIYSP